MLLNTLACAGPVDFFERVLSFLDRPRVWSYDRQLIKPPMSAPRREVPLPRGVRVCAGKMVANAARLSQGEYLSLGQGLTSLWRNVINSPEESARGRGDLSEFLYLSEALVQCLQQAEACPELWDYTGSA